MFGYNIVRNYRRAYGLHATNGILFNHESPRRGSNFVTNKVVKSAVMISLGLSIHSVVTQVARLARDMWNSVNLNDIWENEQRNWDDII